MTRRFAFEMFGFDERVSFESLVRNVIGSGVALTLIVTVHQWAHDESLTAAAMPALAGWMFVVSVVVWTPCWFVARARRTLP